MLIKDKVKARKGNCLCTIFTVEMTKEIEENRRLNNNPHKREYSRDKTDVNTLPPIRTIFIPLTLYTPTADVVRVKHYKYKEQARGSTVGQHSLPRSVYSILSYRAVPHTWNYRRKHSKTEEEPVEGKERTEIKPLQ